MSHDFVILCAAGMLVSVYLMVGQRALFVAIRLYGLQSLLLGAVGVAAWAVTIYLGWESIGKLGALFE